MAESEAPPGSGGGGGWAYTSQLSELGVGEGCCWSRASVGWVLDRWGVSRSLQGWAAGSRRGV